jgi:hypothetical protein
LRWHGTETSGKTKDETIGFWEFVDIDDGDRSILGWSMDLSENVFTKCLSNLEQFDFNSRNCTSSLDDLSGELKKKKNEM